MRLFLVSVPVKSVLILCSSEFALQYRVVSVVFEPAGMTMPRPLFELNCAPSTKSARSLSVSSDEPTLSRIWVYVQVLGSVQFGIGLLLHGTGLGEMVTWSTPPFDGDGGGVGVGVGVGVGAGVGVGVGVGAGVGAGAGAGAGVAVGEGAVGEGSMLP